MPKISTKIRISQLQAKLIKCEQGKDCYISNCFLLYVIGNFKSMCYKFVSMYFATSNNHYLLSNP